MGIYINIIESVWLIFYFFLYWYCINKNLNFIYLNEEFKFFINLMD